jgi:hypothetical protein
MPLEPVPEISSAGAPPPADRVSRDVWRWTFLGGIAVLLAMAAPFFAGKIYTFEDIGSFHLPLRAFYSEQLAQNQSFDWMPSLYCGFYLTGEGQAGAYHPLHWMLYKWLPLSTALGLECLLSYPFLWAGGYLFLNRRLRHRGAALFGGMLFFAAGFNLLHFCHINAVAIIAHIPWLLWCIDIVLTDCRRRHVIFATWGIALLTGSQILLGYPQYVWFSLMFEAAYAGFLLFAFRRRSLEGLTCLNDCGTGVGCSTGAWPRLVIGIGLGVLLGSVQWFPLVDALQSSARFSADSTYLNSNSLHPLNLLQLVAPYFFHSRVVGRFTHEFGIYLGAVPLMLIAWLWMRRHELGPLKPWAAASAWFAVLALILAFGKYGIIYPLQRYIPGIGSFQGSCRYQVLFQMGMMLIATIGFFHLLQTYQKSRQHRFLAAPFPAETAAPKPFWKGYEALWLVVILSILVALVGLIHYPNSQLASIWCILAGVILFFGAACLIARVAAGNRVALIQMVLLTAADLGIYGLSNSLCGSTADIASYVASVATPPGDQSCRIVCCLRPFNDLGIRVGDQITLRGYERADGYLGLEPKKQLDYHRLSALRVAGVRWVEKGPTTQDIDGICWRDDSWGEVPNPLPLVRLVSKTFTSSNPQIDLDRIDIGTTALTEIPLFTEKRGAIPSFVSGSAKLLEKQSGRIRVRTACEKPQLLVLAESYHPGWKAWVEGRQRPVYRVNGDFLGCLVGPRREDVVWEFQPDSLRRGRWFSLLGVCLLPFATVGLIPGTRNHRKNNQ